MLAGAAILAVSGIWNRNDGAIGPTGPESATAVGNPAPSTLRMEAPEPPQSSAPAHETDGRLSPAPDPSDAAIAGGERRELAIETLKRLDGITANLKVRHGTLDELASALSAQLGLRVEVDPSLGHDGDRRFDLDFYGVAARELMAWIRKAFGLGFRILPDGSLQLARQEEIDPRDLELLRGFVEVRRLLDEGWNGVDFDPPADAVVIRSLMAAQAEISVRDESLKNVIISIPGRPAKTLWTGGYDPSRRVLDYRDSGPAAEVLRRLLNANGLDYMIRDGGMRIDFQETIDPERRRIDSERILHEQALARLEGPLELARACSIPELLRRIKEISGVDGAADDGLHRQGVIAGPSAGLTIRAVLDRLANSGIRWGVYGGRLYLVR